MDFHIGIKAETAEEESRIINGIHGMLEALEDHAIWHNLSTNHFGAGDINTVVHNAISGSGLDPNVPQNAKVPEVESPPTDAPDVTDAGTVPDSPETIPTDAVQSSIPDSTEVENTDLTTDTSVPSESSPQTAQVESDQANQYTQPVAQANQYTQPVAFQQQPYIGTQGS